MSNNKLTFSSPGVAKLSWKIKHGDQELDKVDSLILNVNGERIELDPSSKERSYNVDVNSAFYIDADWKEFSARSEKLYVDVISGSMYYGSVVTGTSDEWDEFEIKDYLSSLNQSKLDSLVDITPIVEGDNNIASPGQVLMVSSSEAANWFNKMYCFYCSDEKVDQSHPIMIYPAAYGDLKSIKDSMGNECLNQTGNVGFYKSQAMINGTTYNVYILKSPNSSDKTTGSLPYTFMK